MLEIYYTLTRKKVSIKRDRKRERVQVLIVYQDNEDKENIKPEGKVNHEPGAWEATKENATFADIAGHEKKQAEEFPTPQESLAKSDDELPASGGVGDLLNKNSVEVEGNISIPSKIKSILMQGLPVETAQPPNPDRSFADVTSNKGFPTPEHDTTQETSDLPPLSQLPDVKDMLEKPSGKLLV